MLTSFTSQWLTTFKAAISFSNRIYHSMISGYFLLFTECRGIGTYEPFSNPIKCGYFDWPKKVTSNMKLLKCWHSRDDFLSFVWRTFNLQLSLYWRYMTQPLACCVVAKGFAFQTHLSSKNFDPQVCLDQKRVKKAWTFILIKTSGMILLIQKSFNG